MAAAQGRSQHSAARGRSTCTTKKDTWRLERRWRRGSCCRWQGLPTSWDSVPNPWGRNTVRGCAIFCGDSSSSTTGSVPAVFSVRTWREPLTTPLPSGTVSSFGYGPYLSPLLFVPCTLVWITNFGNFCLRGWFSECGVIVCDVSFASKGLNILEVLYIDS